ncbi:hypothetical protein [Algoriphagus aquimarinus]|uniref:hypothetical protein n=1 Tax=Algoriphagus aquimarinus TaxID=237018 RepID=UPI0030D82704
MAHKKSGHLTVSGEWAKHLRKQKRNQFWKGERNAGKEFVRTELRDNCPGELVKEVVVAIFATTT